ncbi:hypothetical protein GCM10023258_07670 [Terrabacter aeriphilus]|uniref:Uncharacterized protein n=1 Tax=Terrabacter aeriphilus TaxID=515662 RepID=A0ABP9J5Q3_9MICO
MPRTGRLRRDAAAHRFRTAGAWCAAGALVAALGACGQPQPSPDDGVAPTVSVPVQPTITAVTPSDDVIDPSVEPSDGELFDAASSLTDASCEATGGVWSFTGTLTNSDTEKHTFTVAVFIVKRSDGSDVAGKEVDITLEPGATAPVSIPSFHTGPGTGVECLSGVTVKGL